VLKAKQGGSAQFGSQAERDAHYKKHIKQLRAAAADQTEALAQLTQQEAELNSSLNDLAAVSLCSYQEGSDQHFNG
jgi:hypothetical protein